MAGRGARLKRQLARQCQPISEQGMIDLVAKRDLAKEWLKAAIVATPYDPKKCTGLRVRVAMLTAKIEEMTDMQHMNPPPTPLDNLPPASREDELEKLEYFLEDLVARRTEVLANIEAVHAQMLARVTRAVAEFERDFWETDYNVGRFMDRLNELRAENTPLRTQVWDLQAKIKELSGGHDESCSSNVGCNCGPMPDQPGMRATHLSRMLTKEQEKESDPFHVGGCV